MHHACIKDEAGRGGRTARKLAQPTYSRPPPCACAGHCLPPGLALHPVPGPLQVVQALQAGQRRFVRLESPGQQPAGGARMLRLAPPPRPPPTLPTRAIPTPHTRQAASTEDLVLIRDDLPIDFWHGVRGGALAGDGPRQARWCVRAAAERPVHCFFFPSLHHQAGNILHSVRMASSTCLLVQTATSASKSRSGGRMRARARLGPRPCRRC